MSDKEQINCYVRVTGDASDTDDDGLTGCYLVKLYIEGTTFEKLPQSSHGEIATAVLNEFHENQGIEVLDDFEISVYLPNGTLISESDDPEDGEPSIDFKAEYLGSIEESSLPFTIPLMSIEALENAYVEAADALLSKQRQLDAYGAELNAFVQARDTLKEHPEFSGNLPQTYYSGGDLDPEGTAEGFDRPKGN